MSSVAPRHLDRCRILLAEDEPLLLIDLYDTLVSAGAKVVFQAASVQSAMFLVKSETVHCAVLDVKLKDGYVDPVADLLHQSGKGIVFITAVVDTARLLQNWPSAVVLRKPASECDLISASIAVCSSCKVS